MSRWHARYWHINKERWVNIEYATLEDLEEHVVQTGIELHNIHEVTSDRKTAAT